MGLIEAIRETKSGRAVDKLVQNRRFNIWVQIYEFDQRKAHELKLVTPAQLEFLSRDQRQEELLEKVLQVESNTQRLKMITQMSDAKRLDIERRLIERFSQMKEGR